MSSATKAQRAENARRYNDQVQRRIDQAVERFLIEHGVLIPRSIVLHPNYGTDGLPQAGAAAEAIWFDRYHRVRGLALYAPDGVDSELTAHYEYTDDSGLTWTSGMSVNATIGAGFVAGGALVNLNPGAGAGGTSGTVSLVDYPQGYGVRLVLDDPGDVTLFNAQLLCDTAVEFRPLAGYPR